MLTKNAKIFLAVAIVAFLAYMIIDFNMKPDALLTVTFDPQEYSFTMSSVQGIGLRGNSDSAEGIIYTSNFGHFLSVGEDGSLLREGYSIKVAPGELIYWVPESDKIEVGQTINNAIVVTAVRGLSDTVASLSVKITQNEDFMFSASIVEVVK